MVTTEPSGLTYLTDILDIAIDLYATVLAALPGGPSTKAEAVEAMGGQLVASANCLLRQFDSGGAFGPNAPTDPVALARGVAEITFGCIGTVAKQVFTGPLATIVATVVGIPTGLAVSLIGAGDFFRDLFGGRYNYRMIITSSTGTTTKSSQPSCTASALQEAWNTTRGGTYGYTIEADAVTCDRELAIAFIDERKPVEVGNPDFGTAVFVAAGSAWKPLQRFRTPLPEMVRDPLLSAGLTVEQVQRVNTMIQRR